MEFQPITTALSRALALRLEPGSTFLGGGLQLTISPSAQASNRVVLPAPQPIGSIASALGLGLGSSRFLADPANAAFLNSPGLSVITGGDRSPARPTLRPPPPAATPTRLMRRRSTSAWPISM